MQLTSRRASRPDERFSRESDVRGHELQTLTTEGSRWRVRVALSRSLALNM